MPKKNDPLSQLNEIMARLSANPNPNNYQTASASQFASNVSMVNPAMFNPGMPSAGMSNPFAAGPA